MKFGGNDPNLVMIQCGICGNSWWTLDATMPCSTCRLNNLIDQLDAKTLAKLDELIRKGAKIEAINVLKFTISISLKDAHDTIVHRGISLNTP